MTSTSETGHARNVAAFKQLITACTGYGTKYRPAKASISMGNINTLLVQSRAALAALNTAEQLYKDAARTRAETFDPLRQLSTRIINALQASEVTDRTVAGARTILNKLQNKRATPKPETSAAVQADGKDTPIKTISTSQASYDNLAEHFDKLVELVAHEAAYAPNEPDLQAAALRMFHSILVSTNDSVATAITQLANARLHRDQLLYMPKTGMVDITKDIKSYVKSVYKANSAEYRQISGLSVRKLKNSLTA
ncbi:hypothetical protein ACTHGU_14715 [Chitinophagaceae bacterium MMS25-I14]